MRVLDAVLDTAWAMLPDKLETLVSIASRENAITPEALEAYRAQSVQRAEGMEQRDGVAILHAIGPLFRRANLFTEMSGATSYDVLRRDFQIALDDPSIKAILLNIDSPGGDANGIDELAKAVQSSRSIKPVVAYVGGTAASGGYWLACAASEIVVSDAALLGSIGVVMSISKREPSDGSRTFEFVSSQSPHKRADPTTESGAGSLQRIADDLGQVFVDAVSVNRGKTAEQVIAEFGAGSVLVGAKAVAAGMADRLGTFESTLSYLQTIGRTPGRSTRSVKGRSMSEDTQPGAEEFKALQDSNKTLSVQLGELTAKLADRDRRDAIMALPEAAGRELQAKELCEAGVTADAAKKILAAGPKEAADTDEDEDEDELPSPQTYERSRATARGLNGDAPPKKGDRTMLAAAVARTNKRR